MEALLPRLIVLGDIRYRIPETVGLLLLISIFYLVSVFLVLKNANDGKYRHGKGLTILVVGAAFIFRLSVGPLFPLLFGDVFRYH